MVDWEAIREQCIKSGEFVRIEKEEALPLPSFFHETDLGLAKGATRQLRDNCATNSLHIHEFDDHFLAHVDLFNPEYHPVAHGVVDTPGITLAVLGGCLAAFFLNKTIRGSSLLPQEVEDWDVS